MAARMLSLISTTPVKCFALIHPEEVEVGPRGILEDRRFVLVDGNGRRLRSSLTAWPVVVTARYDAAPEWLWMRFPGEEEVEGSALGSGPPRNFDFHRGRRVEGQVVEGPWTDRLARLAGHPVHLVRPTVPRAGLEPVTLIAQASIERMSEEASRPVDGRRFRMLFTLSGCRPHEEDGWAGRLVRIGEALLRMGEPVPRCAVTTRHPETGLRDLDALHVLERYRSEVRGVALPFGVYASVEHPGRARVGDPVELL